MSKINYPEFGRKMDRHDKVDHMSSAPGRMSFKIPETKMSILKHISPLLDEYGMKVDETSTNSDGEIVFSVVTE